MKSREKRSTLHFTVIEPIFVESSIHPGVVRDRDGWTVRLWSTEESGRHQYKNCVDIGRYQTEEEARIVSEAAQQACVVDRTNTVAQQGCVMHRSALRLRKAVSVKLRLKLNRAYLAVQHINYIFMGLE